ncbi:uncharacterized protein LOC141605231 [Silene latifolia]|uniref:uncharacterized protein LOC141605231 n=1 Tax=Silene latifolia TaxID=37657 RepID=UPI003D775277
MAHHHDYQQYPPPPLPHHQYPYHQQPPPQPPQQYLPQPYPPPSHPPPPQYDYPLPHHPNPYDYPLPHHPPPQYPPPAYPTHHYAPDPYDHYPPPRPHHHNHPHPRRNSSKRPREPQPDIGTETPSIKRQAIGNDVLFRVVVPSGQIGKVIGKAGHRVQQVRDLTKATIKIADPIARFEERVIIISSKEKADGGMTDAEKALLQIASLILVDDGNTAQTVSISAAAAASTDPYAAAAAEGHVTPNSVKLLIAGSQAGGLIGVSGQNIDKLRNSSGAAIAVLAPSQLPMCASAHESDRLVQISGESSAVLKAVEEIGVELRANPPKQVISISPTYNLSITRAAQPYMDPNAAAECVTLDMVISETMVGGLIGRAGSNIGRIRTESGAMIKVFGGKGEQKHRQIQLIGTAQQVALAKQRVDEYVYTQLTQQSDDD